MIGKSDLVQRFGETELIELTDPNCEAINEETLNLAIADAIAEAESYVGKIANAPEVLKLKVCDIARYYLHENNTTEIVEKRYLRAIAWLKEAQANPKMLGIKNDEALPNGAVIGVKPNIIPDKFWEQ